MEGGSRVGKRSLYARGDRPGSYKSRHRDDGKPAQSREALLIMERGDKTPDDLDRPEGNSLEENYWIHDVGTEEFISRCEGLNLEVEEWGIDRREDDGSEGVIYDDKLDFKVYKEKPIGVGATERQLVALVDVKTKSSPKYMGRFNARHYDEYVERADEFDVPTYVVMFQIWGIPDTTEIVLDEFVFRVDHPESEVFRTPTVKPFPDGNNAVLVPHWHRQQWKDFAQQVAV